MTNKLVSVIIPTRDRYPVLKDCVKSVLAGTYSPIEVIVVDNHSTDDSARLIAEDFPQVKVIALKANTFAAGARNAGLAEARGDYLLFVDDDNVVDPRMVEELVACMERDARVGLAGPKMLFNDSNGTICWAGASINPLTSRTTYRGAWERDAGQYDEDAETEHIPNVIMMRREALDRAGQYDTIYGIMYEEADHAMRVAHAGFKVMYCARAVTHHCVFEKRNASTEFERPRIFGKGKQFRAYYLARNRGIFMKRFARPWQFAVFLLVFYPMLTLYYLFHLVGHGRPGQIRMHLLGTWHGILYGLTGVACDRFAADRVRE